MATVYIFEVISEKCSVFMTYENRIYEEKLIIKF